MRHGAKVRGWREAKVGNYFSVTWWKRGRVFLENKNLYGL